MAAHSSRSKPLNQYLTSLLQPWRSVHRDLASFSHWAYSSLALPSFMVAETALSCRFASQRGVKAPYVLTLACLHSEASHTTTTTTKSTTIMLDAFDRVGVQLYGKCIDVGMLTQYRVCVVWWWLVNNNKNKNQHQQSLMPLIVLDCDCTPTWRLPVQITVQCRIGALNAEIGRGNADWEGECCCTAGNWGGT